MFDGKARQAQVHPRALRDAICRGLGGQIEHDKKGVFVRAEQQIRDPDSCKVGSQKILQFDNWTIRRRGGKDIANLYTACAGLHKALAGLHKASQALMRPIVTKEWEEELQSAWGDVPGRELDPSKVRKARAEEVA